MPNTLTDVLSALIDSADPEGSVALIGAVARNAWAPPRATTDLDYTLVADRSRDRDDIAAILRTQRRAGREIDWAYV